jgi:hypothetical protein
MPPRAMKTLQPAPHRSIRSESLVVLLYALVTAVYTYPLLLHFFDSVPGGFRDVWHHLWRHWFVSHVIVDLHRLPFHTDLVSYPFGQTLTGGDFNLLVEVAFLILLRFFDLTTSYNLFLFVSLVLTAYSGYFLAYSLYRDRGCAFLCGLIFAFNPTITALMHGGWVQHLFGVWIALYLWSLYRLRDCGSRKPSGGSSLWIGTCSALLVLAMLTSFYNGIALGLASAVFVVFHVIRERDRAFALRWLLSTALAGALLMCLLLPRIIEEVGHPAATGPVTNELSADLANFFLPGEIPLVDGAHPSGQQYISTYFGYTVLIALLIGLSLSGIRPWLWIVTAGVFFALSLGPSLKLAGESIVDLPWRWLHEIMPFQRLTNHFRFNLITMLALGLAICASLSKLLGDARWTSARVALIPSLCVLVLFEYTYLHSIPFPRQMTSTDAPSFLREIGDEDEDFAVAHLPFGIHGKSLFYQTVHQKRVMAPSFERSQRAFQSYPLDLRALLREGASGRSEIRDMLVDLKVKYLIVHDDFLKSALSRRPVHSGLREMFGPPIHVEDGVSAYRVYRKAPTDPVERGRYLNDLAGFSLQAREFELALERIEQAIALDPGVDAYTARRALIVESQAQR